MNPYAVSVTTRAVDSDLVSLADVKTRLGITGSGSDALLSSLIAMASRSIQDYVGRSFALQSYTELTTGESSSKTLYLSRFPVDPGSVVVTYDGTQWASTAFEVMEPSTGLLWRSSCWPEVGPYTADGTARLSIAYRAGYAVPDIVQDFPASTALTAGQWVRTGDTSPLLMEVTTAGTTDAAAPTWPTTAGDTVTSSSVAFTARAVEELPKSIEQVAYLVVKHFYEDRPSDLKSWREGDAAETYGEAQMGSMLPANAMRTLRGWRLSL